MSGLRAFLSAAFIGVLAGCGSWEPYAGDSICPEILTCPQPVSAACGGPMTAVELPAASACDAAVVTDDRLDTYPLGETMVTWRSEVTGLAGTEFGNTCSSTVTVFDDEPPIVVCPRSVTLARPSPDAPWPDVPIGEAQDACDEVTITASPEVLSERFTDVETRAEDGSGNAATCTTSVEVLDLFAVDGLRLLAAELDGEDTLIQLGWDVAPPSDVDTLLVQFAEDAAGPWTTVDTVPGNTVVAEVRQRTPGFWRVQSRNAANALEGGVSESLEVHAISATQYNLSGVPVAGIPFSTSLYGVVRYPTELDDGPFPLVVLLHGNHGNCRRNGTRDDFCGPLTGHECNFDGFSAAPNAEGMTYQAETLAAHGMIAVTISANALNCRSRYIQERAALLRGHVAQWASWNGGDGSELGILFEGHVDLARIGLVGHSRGGDAVSHAPTVFARNPVPGASIQSIFAIAPTDFDDATVEQASYALLLPACDGDVSNLWGSDIYERSEELPHKSQVFMPGANHNYFSTEWIFDDGRRACPSGALVGLNAQTAMLESTLGSWMSRTLNGERPEAWHRAEVRTPPSVVEHLPRELDLRWDYTHAGRELVEDMLDPGASTRGANTYTGFATTTACNARACGNDFLPPTPGLRLEWDAGSTPTAECSFERDSDTSAFDAISFRMVSLQVGRNNGLDEQAYGVVVADADGNTAEFSAADLVTVPHLYTANNVRESLQTIRIPFAAIETVNVDLDTSRIASLTLQLGTDGSAGSVTITDVELGE